MSAWCKMLVFAAILVSSSLSLLPDARSRDPAECCLPMYQFSIVVGPSTTYEPRMTKERAIIYGAPFYKRIAYGWETLSVNLSAGLWRESSLERDCAVAVSKPSDWFKTCRMIIAERATGRTISDRPWEPTPEFHSFDGHSGKPTRIGIGESVVAEMNILPLDADGAPVKPGIYTIRVSCDLASIAANLRSTRDVTEACRTRMASRRFIGQGVFEVFRPASPLEEAEEEMHKALACRNASSEEAIPHLERVLEIDPLNYQALSHLARFYLKRGETEKAKPLVDRCLQADPKNKDCLFYRYWVTERKGPLEP